LYRSSTLCFLPSKQMADSSPNTEVGTYSAIPLRVLRSDISFLYHQGQGLSFEDDLLWRRRANLYQLLCQSSLLPERSPYFGEHCILFLFSNCLDDIAMNVSGATIGQRIIWIEFQRTRCLIHHMTTGLHLDACT